MQTKRNRAIEFYRFLFCCIIYIEHTISWVSDELFRGGFLGVEFFFIVSGFLMMRGIEKQPCPRGQEAKSAFRFLVGRYIRLLPPYLFGLALLIVGVRLFNQGFGWSSIFLEGFPDFLALQIFWKTGSISLHLWFVSALIWASFPVYYLVRRCRDLFLFVIEPIALLVFISLVYRSIGHLNLTTRDTLWMSGFRAFVEIGLGCDLYLLYAYMQRKGVRLKSWVCTCLEVGLLAVILLGMIFSGLNYVDFILIFAFAAFVFVTFLGRGLLSRALDNRVSALLGSLSYMMYLNQSITILATMELVHRIGYWPATALGLTLLAAISWLEAKLLRFLRLKLHGPLVNLVLEKSEEA